MGTALIQIKIMPEGLETPLDEIKKIGEKNIAKLKGKVQYKEEPIAFGLKALIATVVWPEEQDTDLAENAFKNIKGVMSSTIIDYRRAFG